MPEATATFDGELERVGDARRFCQATLREWGLEAYDEPVSMLVTELATNCVLHARTRFEVSVSFDGEVLRVAVTDSSPRLPVTKSHSSRAMSGRGLHLVAAYADAWGVDPGASGKTVWASVRVLAQGGLGDEHAGDAGASPARPLDEAPAARRRRRQMQVPDAPWAA